LAYIFYEQKARFLAFITSAADFDFGKQYGHDLERLFQRALDKTYSKAWYEYHINAQFDLINKSVKDTDTKYELRISRIVTSSGRLGRLIEQYYWKFLIEKSAISGEKISKSAKSGGHIRASKQKRVHEEWQLAARAVWQENPTRSKMTVAAIVKQRLKLTLSAKHISRVLTRP
jgi:hypothetical protein